VTRPCNDTFLRALLKEPTEHTPVWLMRQAGRYLPEYRETRAACRQLPAVVQEPCLACEVTLQPLARYDLDAAILFSDILTMPDAMGLGLYFTDGEGPRFERPLREEWAIRDLTAPDPWDHLRYVMDAVVRNQARAEQLGAADRLFRQSLHPGLLHGRRRFEQRLPLHQGHALRPTRPACIAFCRSLPMP
jgi:uroporphyrinogen decarboxylase